ncbi:MAG TPA: GAF domain-containing protein [Ignavibacteriaceae bacterium]|nr:GAF domain-containing protein [Ignavibacteriaceae bacterium]
MDQRQRKRVLIFLIVPLLASILFISDDFIIRIITILLLIVYVAFIIFLRDSLKFNRSGYIPDLAEDDIVSDDDYSSSPLYTDPDESFQIISKNKKIEVITQADYTPEFRAPKTTLKPPDLKERFNEIANEKIPDELGHDGQFSFVLDKILTVMKEAYAAHTAVFFWFNKSKEKLSIERFISNSNGISRRKIDVEDDILSKIVEKGEPELLSDIPATAEADVIRYYDSPQGIRSFVGVPLFYDKALIAIIAVDAKVEDAFGIETIYALGRFVRVITMIISIFEEKHSDTISQQRLNGLLNLIDPEKKIDSEEELVDALHNTLGYLLNWDASAFVYYKPVDKKFQVLKIFNKTSLKYIGEGLEVDISGTLAGKAIATGTPIKIDDTSAGEYKRYSKSEDVSFDGSFLAIPVIYHSQNYGVLCFESLKKNIYTNSDVIFLKSAINILSYIVYSYSTQQLLKSLLAVDVETRALNADTFKERMAADLVKAEQSNLPGALALIRIDDFLEEESLFEGNPLSKVLAIVTDTISKEMTLLNLFGRIGEKIFGVYFFGAQPKDVFLWAEKLRVKIARKPIAVVSKQTTYTISVGVAAASNKSDVEEIIYNADLALQKAIQLGGNRVRNVN